MTDSFKHMVEKTGILLLYLTEEETAFYEKYEEISEEQAYKALEQTEALYQKLETIARDRLKNMKGAMVLIENGEMGREGLKERMNLL